MKKILLTIMMATISVAGFGQSGDFGENNALHWSLANGVLTISGTGAIPEERPWNQYGSIKQAIIEEGITEIAYENFYKERELTSVSLPNSLKSIGRYAFQECNALTEIVIPDGVECIGYKAFDHCYSLRSITIGDNVNLGVIMDGPSYACGLAHFARCYNDENDWGLVLKLGKNVIFPGESNPQTFSGCSSMSEIHITDPNPPELLFDIFNQYTHTVYVKPSWWYFIYSAVNKSLCKLYVPKGSLSAYQSANIWRDFANIIEEDNTAIPELSAPSARPVAYYNLQGQTLAKEPASGIYIIKYDDGTAKKVLKKE